MHIQLNTTNGVENTASLDRWADAELRQQLSRFADDIVRVEVHLSDENAGRAGSADKRCTMEARMSGHGSVAVHEDGENTDRAFRGALDKLKRALDSRKGREADHRDRTTIRQAADDLPE